MDVSSMIDLQDQKYLIINSSTDSSSEVRVLENDLVSARLIKSRQAGVEYYIDHTEVVLLDLTSEKVG